MRENEAESNLPQIHFTLYNSTQYDSDSANNYFSTCLHLNWRDVRLLQLYKFGHTGTWENTQAERRFHIYCKKHMLSFISAHFRFAARHRRTSIHFLFSSFFYFYSVRFLFLLWHWLRVYCISNCDAVNIFLVRFSFPFRDCDFYRFISTAQREQTDTYFLGHRQWW